MTGVQTCALPIYVLRQTLAELATPATEGLPPFHAGMVGYLGYDVVRQLETLPDTCIDDLGLPELVMMLASQVAVLDHRTHEVHLIFNAINYNDTDESVERASEIFIFVISFHYYFLFYYFLLLFLLLFFTQFYQKNDRDRKSVV